jgi:hypothetical protein
LAGVLASSLFSACGFGGSVDASYPYWILNDSGATVIVDVREVLHRTFVVPPHTYGSLFESGSLDLKWAITIVDGQCRILQAWTPDAAHDLLYVAPNGDGALANDLAWSHGLRTAKEADLVQRAPICS